MPREFKARGAFGLGHKEVRNTDVYLVTDEFGFGACRMIWNEQTREARFFEPSEEELFRGLFGLLDVIDVPYYAPYSDLVDDIMAYESGEMDALDVPSFFQRLIDQGWTGKLQGHYGKTAATLISCGLCHERVQPSYLAVGEQAVRDERARAGIE